MKIVAKRIKPADDGAYYILVLEDGSERVVPIATYAESQVGDEFTRVEHGYRAPI